MSGKDGAFLHRSTWLDDALIGELPAVWNWLAIEYPSRDDARIIHYTLGTPVFTDYRSSDKEEWCHAAFRNSTAGLDSE